MTSFWQDKIGAVYQKNQGCRHSPQDKCTPAKQGTFFTFSAPPIEKSPQKNLTCQPRSNHQHPTQTKPTPKPPTNPTHKKTPHFSVRGFQIDLQQPITTWMQQPGQQLQQRSPPPLSQCLHPLQDAQNSSR